MTIVSKNNKKLKPPMQCQGEFQGIASWIRFLRQLRIPDLFASLPDARQQGKTRYSMSSLVMWAFSACSFRTGSKNALHTSLSELLPHQKEGMQSLLGSECIPHVSTVDHALATLPLESLGLLPLHLLKQLEKRKFFYNHLELLHDGAIRVGLDGFHTHTYDHPHAINEDGSNACPFCLPRKRNKGTSKEITYWVHCCVTVSLLCQGLTLPLYLYPLRAAQIDKDQTDEKLKEECELKAAHTILPLIRQFFPRLPIMFLGDALYANKPMIRLCSELNIDYIIVLKEGTLKKLNEKCDELSQLELYKRYYRCEAQEKSATIRKQANWFNRVDVGEGVVTHVIRYKEIYPEAATTGYQGAWITSKKISNNNCFRIAQEGRMRWNHEDIHNTLNNRGYNMQHDMTRTDPSLLMIWRFLAFIAQFVFTLFECTTIARATRKSRSIKKFAQDLLQQLLIVPWEQIKRSYMLCQSCVQFRYLFEEF
jgi:hypothetical protein